MASRRMGSSRTSRRCGSRFILAQVGGSHPPDAGIVSDDPVRHIDILPTVLDALGRTAGSTLPGRSLLTAASDPSAITSYFEALSTSLNRGWAPLTGVIVGHDKLVELPHAGALRSGGDPREQLNLIDKNRDRRRVLEVRLRDLQATGPADRRDEDAETRAQLNALGYVTGSGTAPHQGPYTEKDDPKRLLAIDQRIHDAIDLFQRGNARSAAAIYRDLIAQRPDMATGYEHLAFVAWETGQPAVAIATLQQALAAGVANAEIESKLGMYLAESGRAREGLPLLERAASRPPVEVDTLNALAIGYARAGMDDRAIATFRRVLAIDPHSAMAWQNIGSVELGRGQLEPARDAFTRALAADPNWAAAHTGLGVVERRSNQFDAAIASWKTAVALDPREFDALYNLVTELALAGRAAEARPYAEQFVATAPAAQYGKDIERVRGYLRQ